jgi:diguanylate cyclase (GGDEF)-like protein
MSSAARRYVLGLILIGAVTIGWELSRLSDLEPWLWPLLSIQAVLAFFFKRNDSPERFKKYLILLLTIVGLLIIGINLSHLQEQGALQLAGLGSLAAAAHILKQPGPTSRSSHQVGFIVYGFSMVLLGTPATVVIILMAHVLEYTWGSYYPWFIQCFNMATFTISASLAGLVIGWIAPDEAMFNLPGSVGIVVGFLAFTLVNHLLIGVVLKLARGQSIRESGVFGTLTLMIDFSFLSMGAGSALLWNISPYAIALGIIPLYLIYSTLRVPSLERETKIDSKTGLFNARYFAETLRLEMARAQRHDRSLSLAMADLDLLRDINNTYGHLAGDVVLKNVAKTMKDLVRDYDVVARFGGEEFAILMPETVPETAMEVIESIRAAVANTEFLVSTSAVPVRATVSFGIAGRVETTDSPEDLIHHADLALYRAKDEGRNRTVVASNNGRAD